MLAKMEISLRKNLGASGKQGAQSRFPPRGIHAETANFREKNLSAEDSG